MDSIRYFKQYVETCRGCGLMFGINENSIMNLDKNMVHNSDCFTEITQFMWWNK